MGFTPGVNSSPHHIRSILGTYGEAVLGSCVSEGGQRTDVTGLHYALHDGTYGKWPIMRKWAVALEVGIAKATFELEPVEELKAAIEAARYRRGDDERLEAAE